MDGELRDALVGRSEVEVGFVRPDGRNATVPVWFTVYASKLELLPMYGLKTGWFRAVERAGEAEIIAGKVSKKLRPAVLRQGGAVDEVKERFAAKYGEEEVRKYYPTSEVALELEL